MPKRVDTLALPAILGPRFVVLAGSAISGAALPRLAMVPQVLEQVLSLVAAQPIRTPPDAVAAAYGRALSDGPTRYRSVRETTKFEEFLWMLERASCKECRDSLLRTLYVCDHDEYGINHSALIEMLRSGRCLACLTTNFDNALELAGPEISSLAFEDDVPRFPPALGDEPLIMKLHGDARRGNCQSIPPQLAESARLQRHNYRRTLLRGHSILVVGYSGTGDIDISPHLQALAESGDATVVWASFEPAKLPAPSWAQFEVACNLGLDNGSDAHGRENVLVSLAQRAAPFPRGGKARDWPAALGDWHAQAIIDRAELVRRCYAWRESVPVLHMNYRPAHTHLRREVMSEIAAFAEAGIYLSAIRLTGVLLRAGDKSVPKTSELLHHRGFSLWRIAMLRLAMHTLEKAIDLQGMTPGTQPRSMRVYLEVVRDALRLRAQQAKRARLYSKWNVAERLLRFDPLNETSPTNVILGRLVVLDIRRLTGDFVSVSEVRKLLKEAIDTQSYGAAWAAATSLAMLAPEEGARALQELASTFKRAGGHYVRKCKLSLVEARLAERPSVSYRVRLAVSRLQLGYGVIGSLARAVRRERRYARCSERWAKWYRDWTPSSAVMIADPDLDC